MYMPSHWRIQWRILVRWESLYFWGGHRPGHCPPWMWWRLGSIKSPLPCWDSAPIYFGSSEPSLLIDGLEAQFQSKCCFPSRSPLRATLQARNSDIAMPNQQPGTKWPSVCSSPGPLDCSPLFLEHSEPTAIYLARRSQLPCYLLRVGGNLRGAGNVLLLAWVVVTGVCSEFIKLYTYDLHMCYMHAILQQKHFLTK